MTLLVLRQPAHGESVLGRLYIDGQPASYTLERASTLTPAGVYVITLTTSQRCCDGILWSPDDDPTYRDLCKAWASGEHRLLLVNDVPGRDGIRLHAANEAKQLDGCTATGTNMIDWRLTQSRLALAHVMNAVVPQLIAGQPVTIEYRPAA